MEVHSYIFNDNPPSLTFLNNLTIASLINQHPQFRSIIILLFFLMSQDNLKLPHWNARFPIYQHTGYHQNNRQSSDLLNGNSHHHNQNIYFISLQTKFFCRISALYLILNGTKEEHLNMLEGGIIAKLLDEKWSTFAKVSTTHLHICKGTNNKFAHLQGYY